LIKHPFISSKFYSLTLIEKPGKAIYLIKERSKLVRVKKNQTKHELGARLGVSVNRDEEMKDDHQFVTKRRKL
jgi:hypothetical protein